MAGEVDTLPPSVDTSEIVPVYQMFDRCDAIVTNTVDLLGTTPAHAFG